MSAEDRSNNPARKPNLPSSTQDKMAQETFSAHGFNKGKAGDMATNMAKNVSKSVASAKGDYEARRTSVKNIEARKRSY